MSNSDVRSAVPKQVVFIDSRAPDIQALIAGVTPGELVFVLDASSDGIQQIANILVANNLTGLSAISIVGHGTAGAIDLGSTVLNESNLAEHSAALATIGAALTADGDIALYACNTAAGAAGQQFIADLATYTSADVAAATHVVGDAAHGGSWTLDAATGSIEASTPFTAATLESFEGTLAPLSGQLWYGVNGDTVGSSNPFGYINTDGSGQTVAGSSPGVPTHYSWFGDIGLDTAPGLYFAINKDADNDYTSLVVGRTATGATIGTPILLNPNGNTSDYEINALAVDPKNDYIYIGIWGTVADSGIIRVPYNQLTGVVNNGNAIISGGVIDPSLYVVKAGANFTNPIDFSLDVANQKLYFAANDMTNTGAFYGNGYANTNGVYVVDLATATPTTAPTLLSTSFTSDINHSIVAVAVNAADNVVYFATTDYSGDDTFSTIYWMSTSGGAVHQMTLPAGITLPSIANSGLAYDPVSNQLIVSDDGNGSTPPPSIYQLQLDGPGTSFTGGAVLGNADDAVPSAFTTGIAFNALASIGALSGSSTQALQGGNGITLLGVAPTNVTDSDGGGNLASATVKISNGQAGDLIGIDANFTLTTTPTSVVIGGLTFLVSYNAATYTLTIANPSGVLHTYDEFETALAHVTFKDTGTDTTTVGHPTRSVVWQVNDGANGNPTGAAGTNNTTTTITIDRAPVAGADTGAAVSGGSNGSGNVLTNDTDLDGDARTVSAVNGSGANVGNSVAGTYGHLTLGSNGSYTYTADNTSAINGATNGSHPTDSFTYTVSDGNGGTSTTTLTITIDRAPTVVADTNTVVAGGTTATTSVLTNDSDKDGDSFTVTAVNGSGANVGNSVAGTYGHLTLGSNGSYTYAADNAGAISGAATGSHLTDTFTYTVNDGQGGTATSTVTITLDRAPTVVADTNTALSGGAQVSSNVLTNDTDKDGDTLTVSAVTGGTVGNLIQGTYANYQINADGTYTYIAGVTAGQQSAIAGAGPNLVDHITFTVSDGHGGTTSSTLDISIETAPIITSITASGTDIDGGGNGDINAGHVVTLTLHMSSAVTVVGGVPTLTLNDGGTATYQSTSGSDLIFTYTVQPGHNTADLAVAALDTHGATIQDGAAQNADFTIVPAVTGTLQIDTITPTVSIAADDTSLVAGQTSTVTFTFSEAVSNFALGDVTATGGALSNLIHVGIDGSGHDIYTAIFTPGVTDTEAGSIQVTASSYNDGAGNAGGGSNAVNFTGDTQAPTVSIAADDTTLLAGQTATLTFTFSEAVSNFAIGDVTVSGGALSNLVHVGVDGSGHDIYTATFTPSATNTEVGSAQVAGGSYTDGVGNTGSASNTVNFTGDTLAPTVSVSADDTSLVAGQTATVTFTFSEAVSSFDLTNTTATGGALSNLIHVGIDGAGHDIYTATFTPDVTNTEVGSVQVTAASYTDGAGNAGGGGTVNFTGDTQAPTVSIAADQTTLLAGQTATLTFTFSEAVSNFVIGDVTVSGGALSNLNHVGVDGSGHDIYTATFTPSVTNTEVGSAQVTAASYTDGVGNTGSASNTVNFSGDTLAPTVTISADDTTLVVGQTATVTFTFSEAVSNFDLGDTTVTGGALSSLIHVGIDGSGHDIYTATFTPEVSDTANGSAQVTVSSYTDVAGNAGAASNTITFTGDTQGPTVSIVAVNDTLAAGQTTGVIITFSEAVSNFALDDIAVSGGALSNLIHLGVDGFGHDIYNVTFTPDVTNTEVGSVQVTASSYNDGDGNAGGASNVVNFTGDTQAPTVSIAADQTALLAGQTATITFTFSEAVSNFNLGNVLAVGGGLSNLVHVGVDGSGHDIYTAILTPFVSDATSGSVWVASPSYTDGGGNVGSVSNVVFFSGDTKAPTVSIAADDTSLVAGQTATLTFTFSEAVSNFALGDVTVTGGALGNLVHVGIDGSGHDIYTATFTPNVSNTANGSAQVTVSSYTDTSGNSGAASNTVTFTGDTLVPTVSSVATSGAGITAGTGSLNAGDVVTFTVNASEVVFVTGSPTLTLNDGGVATYTGGNGTSALTFSYTVLAGQNTSDLTVTAANLNGGSIRDGAGNAANLSAAATNPAGTLTIDTTAPTVSVSSNLTNLHAGETATVTFTFSEAVQDFTLGDVLATGGSLSGLTQVGTTNVYTAAFTPVATNTEVGQVQVNVSSYTDIAGNAGGASNAVNYTGDTLRPHGTAAANPGSGVLMYGQTVHITLSFTEAVAFAGGIPVLTLNDGGTATFNPAATLLLGDPTKMVFDYTVGANDSSVSTLAITSVSGGNITDIASNASDSLATSFNGLSVQTSVITAHTDSNHLQVGTTISTDAAHGVLANDTDTNPTDHLVVSAVNGSAGGVDHTVNGSYGSLTLHADGSYSYTANGASNGYLVDTFSYTANNGHGQSSSSTLSIAVVGNNYAYVAVPPGGSTGTGYGNIVLDGSAGGATLTSLNSYNAQHILIGGPGDILNSATSGRDTFVFAGDFGHNTINNFTTSLDTIQLQQSQVGSIASVMADLHQVGADAVLTLDASHVVTITNMQVASLTAANFHLV
ncbi:Ig-like domain-containing protein [Bradyrhizobium prioriisuperbiae]|uniref:Ig-like domain-containing protein n=1 Tax=Bradyrhizobium prioriisuperbiae TaxID=2854389 RepID=UPI0028E297D6|nr:Ig-like domain-containing protein [Bradyrhizobium prioritasuperba]